MSASCELLLFQTTHRCHSVFSCFSPDAAFHERLVASEKVATRFPPDVDRTSGSAPRFPINVTLFKLRLTVPPGKWRVELTAHSIRERSDLRNQIPAHQALPLHFLRYFIKSRLGQNEPQHAGVFHGLPIIGPSAPDLHESP